MTGCCALGCTSRSEGGIRMHRFPQNPTVRKTWVANIGRKPANSSRLCELHFDERQFEFNPFYGKRQLKRNAVPTVFPPPPSGYKAWSKRWRNPSPQRTHLPTCKIAVPELIGHDHVYTSDAKAPYSIPNDFKPEFTEEQTPNAVPQKETTVEEISRLDDRIKKLERKLHRAKKKRKQLRSNLKTAEPRLKVVFPGPVHEGVETWQHERSAPACSPDHETSARSSVDNIVFSCSQNGIYSGIIPQLLESGLIRTVDVVRTDSENKA